MIAAEMPKKQGDLVTKLPGEVEREKTFALISRFAKAHAAAIDVSFNDVRLGTPRNYFMKVNYQGLKAAFAGLTIDATDEQIENAVETYATDNPTAIYRVKKNGVPTVYLTGAWDDDANPITGSVFYKGSKLMNGANAVQLVTGETVGVQGTNLKGDFVLVTTSSLGGSTADQPSSTALTEVKMTKFAYSGKVAAALNNKYLVAVKVGGTTLLTLKNEDTPSMG